ncbi:MAG: hypothetical protein E4H14_10430 [Candidatus Thorarchaeota archaeon]|nr:MAG: hypothetical protein E4H14_10430 [Candidatus Thorarchaeota archaeon]
MPQSPRNVSRFSSVDSASRDKSLFDQSNVDSWDLPKKLTYFMKLGIGRAPGLKPPKLDAPTTTAHKDILDTQFAKATNDYYMRLTQIDPDTMRAYEDFEAMEYTPEIASALDIYADECLTNDEFGDLLTVKTKNIRVKKELDRLFNDVLDVRRNLWGWTRSMCKYGNHYMLMDIDDQKGIIGHMTMPAREMIREEAYDGNLNSVKLIWQTQNLEFDAWQVAHFRLLNDDRRYPYGTSMLESARRIWKQLTLAEDAMIVYRITRAPERRVFKIDVGNIDPNDVPNYMEKIKRIMKRTPAVEHTTGKVSFKYNVMSVDEDFFIPVRGDRSSDIDTLAGASNLDEIADIEYLQGKMFAALKIPKAFLSYEEDVNAKATLAGQDARFARTIQRIQGAIISELTKIALIHLYAIGIRDRDQLGEFKITLTNPNTALELENLELLNSRASTLSSLWDETSLSPVSLVWGLRNIMNFSDAEIKLNLKQQYLEGKVNLKFEEENTPEFEQGNQQTEPGEGGFGNNEQQPKPEPAKPAMEISESEFDRRINRMVDLSHTVPSMALTEDENPLVDANENNNEKTLALLKEVDSLLKSSGRIKLKKKKSGAKT